MKNSIKRIFKRLGKKKSEYILLGLILLLAFALRVYRIEQPQDFYFDEVYHAYTAREYLHGNIESYQFWAEVPDEGMAYAWDHPPVAKLAMMGGMAIFGENSFGWRIGSVLTGVGMVLGVWALAKRLFKSRKIALLAAFLLAIEGSAIAMARIAMTDSYLTCFIIWALYFYSFVREKHFDNGYLSTRKYTMYWLLATVFTGLAVSTKWTGFFLFGIYGLDWLVSMIRSLRVSGDIQVSSESEVLEISAPVWYKGFGAFRSVFLIGVGSLIIYLLSYTQFFLLGNSLSDFWETIRQSWIYHTTVDATHPYQSTPMQWIISARPVYMYYGQVGESWSHGEEWVSAIANVGNYAILTFGLISLGAMLYKSVRKFKWEYLYILASYLVLFVPWVLSPRIMFSYHYLPSSSLLVIPLAWFLLKLFGRKDILIVRLVLITFVGLVVAIFCLLIPFNTGFPVSSEFFNEIYLPLID